MPDALGPMYVVACIGSSVNLGEWIPVSGYTNRPRVCDIRCRAWGGQGRNRNSGHSRMTQACGVLRRVVLRGGKAA